MLVCAQKTNLCSILYVIIINKPSRVCQTLNTEQKDKVHIVRV